MNGGVILLGFVLAEQQQAEGVARPAIVIEPALEALFLRANLIVNGLRDLRFGRRQIANLGVIRLRAAHRRIDQRDVGRAEIERRESGAVIGLEQGGITVGGEIDSSRPSASKSRRAISTY